jgi:diacylglycerol kinase family enzyme
VAEDSYLFIINPSSGTSIGKDPDEAAATIASFVKAKGATAKILFTERGGHATELVRENLLAQPWKAVVAVGGDGTVNETAKALVHGNTPLGILALGSGNGLARHLELPLTLTPALNRLFDGSVKTIDSAELNGMPFFCTAGMGFDAYVGYLFSQQKQRGLATYVSVSMKSFWDYKPQKYRLNGKEIEVFSLSFANAGQFGNNAWISPTADLQDGLLNVCTIRPFPTWYGTALTYRLFTKRLKPSAYISYQTTQNAVIESATPPLIHYDGEPLQLDTNRIEIKIKPKSLNVIA